MNLGHVEAITDEIGIFEHCLGDQPRTEHGYCVDDVARAMIAVERTATANSTTSRLASTYATFLGQSQAIDGRVTNRRALSGSWCGTPSTEDHWGRALWAWGTSVRWSRDPARAGDALKRFELSARQRSPFLRSMLFASLGACEVLETLPQHAPSRTLVQDTLAMIPAPGNARWPWPEERLTYANAALPEVMMLGGTLLDDTPMVRHGKTLLGWLLDVQTIAGRLSIIPHTGWSLGEPLPAFDQQPIEVAALVNACSTAYDLTSDPTWRDYAILGRRWFDGHNDQGMSMREHATGAGFDALTSDGRNENQGAESTLACVSTFERTERLLQVAA